MCCRITKNKAVVPKLWIDWKRKFQKKYDIVFLDASLSAVCLYEHRGYKTVGHGIYVLQNDVKLVYEIMEKRLKTN